MPCPFTGPKMFCASPNFLSQSKNLTAFSAPSKPFVPAQKPISRNANHLFVWHKMFVTATTCKLIFGLAQKVWTSTKDKALVSRKIHSYKKIVETHGEVHQVKSLFIFIFHPLDIPNPPRWSQTPHS